MIGIRTQNHADGSQDIARPTHYPNVGDDAGVLPVSSWGCALCTTVNFCDTSTVNILNGSRLQHRLSTPSGPRPLSDDCGTARSNTLCLLDRPRPSFRIWTKPSTAWRTSTKQRPGYRVISLRGFGTGPRRPTLHVLRSQMLPRACQMLSAPQIRRLGPETMGMRNNLTWQYRGDGRMFPRF